LTALPNVELRREEIAALPPQGTVIVACGPLPSDPLAAALDALVGGGCTITTRPRRSSHSTRSIPT